MTEKIIECRQHMLTVLRHFDMDVGVEAMMSLLAGACAAVPPPLQQSLLSQVTKSIRAQYKEIARVQREENIKARNASREADSRERGVEGQGKLPSGNSGSTEAAGEGLQSNPPGND